MMKDKTRTKGPVSDDISPSFTKKKPRTMKAHRAVNRITFIPSEANPGETLYVYVPKLNEEEVIVPVSLALRFNIDISGGTPTTVLSRTCRGHL